MSRETVKKGNQLKQDVCRLGPGGLRRLEREEEIQLAGQGIRPSGSWFAGNQRFFEASK